MCVFLLFVFTILLFFMLYAVHPGILSCFSFITAGLDNVNLEIGRTTKRKRLLPIQCDKWLTIVYHVMYNAYKVNGQRIILDDDNSW